MPNWILFDLIFHCCGPGTVVVGPGDLPTETLTIKHRPEQRESEYG